MPRKKSGGYGSESYDHKPGSKHSMDEYGHDYMNPKTSSGNYYRPKDKDKKGNPHNGHGY